MDGVRPWSPGWKIAADHPVVNVNWNDATEFCKWLSKKEGHQYRLPTEAEWEYACRAGTQSRYSFGNNPEELVECGNVADQDYRNAVDHRSMNFPLYNARGEPTDRIVPFPFLARRDGYAFTAPVGSFRPNGFELYDMHGNVSEWCSDWIGASGDDYYKHSPTDDPQGPAKEVVRVIGESKAIPTVSVGPPQGTRAVVRGGGFADSPPAHRCAERLSVFLDDYNYSRGFRVVREH